MNHDPKAVEELASLTLTQLIERLRGVYRIQIADGCGPLNGETEFVRTFETSAIHHEAARRLEYLDKELTRLREGRFTEVEFQSLCHNIDVQQGFESFADGCLDYQRKMFGKCERDR